MGSAKKMKRVAAEEVPVEELWEYERLEEEIRERTIPENARVVYAIVAGPTRGLFRTHEEVRRVGGHLMASGAVNVCFPTKRAASAWYKASQALPRYGPHALEVHVSSRCFDVSQEHDYRAAVAIYFGPNDARNLCAPATTTSDLEIPIFYEVLKRIPAVGNVRIVWDAQRLVYGINYGLWEWTKHTLLAESPDEKERELCDLVRARGIELVWRKNPQNVARVLTEKECHDQYHHPSTGRWKRERNLRCIALVRCLYFKARVPKDVALFIGQVAFEVLIKADDGRLW